MDTAFSLVYYECEKQIFNLSDAIIGPELFGSKQAAIDKLFKYVENRLSDGLSDVFDLYLEGTERVDGLFDNDLTEYFLENEGEKIEIIKFSRIPIMCA